MAIQICSWNESLPADFRHGVVAFGNFDGVHRGHASLVAQLCIRARALAGPAVVVTFDPHPLQLLRPDQFQPVLTNLETRAEILSALGANHILIMRTTQDLLGLSAAEFFQQVVCDQLGARGLVEGENFRFGHQREGSVEMLQDLCRPAGIALEIVPPLKTADGIPVSSSRVRSALLEGDIRGATALLDRPFRLTGCVVMGERRGQSIGFPTANLERIPVLLPRDGVYAVRVGVGTAVWPGAANIGANPTFGGDARKVEVHLIGFQGDLYEREISVDFLDRLRDVRTFTGPGPLVEQLRLDIERARAIASVEERERA